MSVSQVSDSGVVLADSRVFINNDRFVRNGRAFLEYLLCIMVITLHNRMPPYILL